MFWIWAGFIAIVLVLVALDLFVFNRKDHVIKVREALLASAVWIGLALAFTICIYFAYGNHWYGLGQTPSEHHPHGLNGREAVVVFLTGYVIEESLSVDNLFVMAMIFTYFGIPPKLQHRVLIWGILGAQVMRGVMIALGATLIQNFSSILYVFGAFLLYTAWKMMFGNMEPDPKNNAVIRLARRFFSVTTELHGHHFVVPASEVLQVQSAPDASAPVEAQASASTSKNSGRRWVLTPLMLALIAVETTDLVFAVDSIPAIFAITTDPFLVFTSNIFAILGLRSLYFVLAGVLDKFRYLKVSLATILALVGVKMLSKHWLEGIPHLGLWTLVAVGVVLGAGIVASIMNPGRTSDPQAPAPH